MKKISAVAVIADGSEELEAVAVIDILRRCGISVTVAGLEKKTIVCAHGTILEADVCFDAQKMMPFDAIFLPGGLNGSLAFYNSEAIQETLKLFAAQKKIISAICAAPIALAKAGLLEGKRFTMYPGFETYLDGKCSTGTLAETDGTLVTGKGPGAVFAFARELTAALGAEAEFEQAAQAMFLPF